MVGSKLQDRYELREELGRGGMGVVYRGWDPVLQREVAVKMIPPLQLTRETEERFQREAQVVAGMDHPSIVPIHDFGRHDGSLFFVMPFVGGTPLQSLIREGSLILDEILEIGIQVAEALEHSHSRGVIHRDVKPSNVMVTRDSRGLRVRVMDFGLARGAAERSLTKTGGLVGTLTNLSPEQISSGSVDPRSDVYALGTVLYECLAGEPPFSGAVHSVLYRIVHEPPRPLAGPDGGGELAERVLACLAKDPAERPQSGAELAAALAEIRAGLDDDQRLQTVGGHARPVALRPTQPIPSPLIGRQKEWSALQSRLAAALAGECQLVLLEGDAGTGKTRLLVELENLARTRRLRVVHGRFADRESAIPYQGLCELIQDYFRPHEPSSSSASGTQPPASADFSDLAADLVSFFPVLSEIRDLQAGHASAGHASAGRASAGRAASLLPAHEAADPTRLYELLARALARIGGGRPLIVAVENLHEGDVSLAALAYIVRRLGATPTLVIGTYRRAEVDTGHPLVKMLKGFADDPRFAEIALGSLGEKDFRRLVELQLGSAAIREELLRRLFEATEGNPYFGRELVRWLLESGSLARDDSGAWTILGEAAFSTAALPATIQQAVERRIERLPKPLRHLLSLASVLGRSFTYEDLETLVELDAGAFDGDLDEAIDQLVDEGLLEEEAKARDDFLCFSRGVVRDVLYHELSRRKRRLLHRRYARELERRWAGRLERVYPRLVHHFAEGDVADKTVAYALLLARKALAAYSPEDALRAARVALEFVDEETPVATEGELCTLLAAAYQAKGATGKALRQAARAAEAYERAGDGVAAAGAALLAAETAWQARRVDDARPWVDRGIELAQASGAADTLRRLLTLGATVANLRGEHQQARRYLEDAERLAPEEGSDEGHEPVRMGGTLRGVLPYPVAAVDPVALETDEEFEVAANVFETLLAADADGNLIPALCAEWQGSDDGLSFELTLRRDVCFSDGRPLSGADVAAAVERLRQRRRTAAGFNAVAGLELLEAAPAADGAEPGGDRLRFRLAEPLPIFPALLTDPVTAIAREAVVDGETAVLGTGPFRLLEKSAERVVLERNPCYWRGAPPPLDRIELMTSLDAAGIAEGLRSGELDLGRDLLPADLEAFQRDPRFRTGLVEATKKNVYFLLFNRRGPIARQAAVRRALLGVVRVQDLVWRTLGRFAQPAVCYLPPGIFGHDPGRRHATVGRARAEEWLAEAGVERPLRLQAAIHPLFADRYAALMTALCAEWAALGVEVVNQTPTIEDFLPYWQGKSDVDVLIGRWNADFSDPDNFTFGLFHSAAGRLRAFYSSPDADRLLERARQERHTARRLGLYQRFEELLAGDHVLLPLFHDVDYRIAGPHVRRLRLESSPPYVDYARVAKHEEAPAAAERQRLVEGGEIHVALPVAFATLDPAADNASDRFEVTANVFEPLTRVAEGARIVPWLAAFFAVPGGGGYHFRLRDRVRFHDGRRLTARDVRYTFERVLKAPDSRLHFLLLPIRGAGALRDGKAADLAGFRILSTEEFVVELEGPLAFFPAFLSHPGLGIVPEGADELAASWRDGCVGTGPFRVLRLDPREGADLERNPQYWRPEVPRAHRLWFHFAVMAEQAVADFRAGRLSIAGHLRPADVAVLRADPELAAGYRESPRLSTVFLAFNSRQGVFADADFRRAFAAALDLAAPLHATAEPGVIGAHGLQPPGLLGYEPRRPAAGPRGFDTGDFRGVRLRVGLHSAFLSQYADFWEALRRDLVKMGLKVEVVEERLVEIVRAGRIAEVDFALGRWIADYPDADAFFMGLLHSREGVLAQLFDSPGVDVMIDKGRRETDPALRHSIYREIEDLLARDRLLLPLFHEQNYCFAHPTVRGLRLGLSMPEVRYEELYVEP